MKAIALVDMKNIDDDYEFECIYGMLAAILDCGKGKNPAEFTVSAVTTRAIDLVPMLLERLDMTELQLLNMKTEKRIIALVHQAGGHHGRSR